MGIRRLSPSDPALRALAAQGLVIAALLWAVTAAAGNLLDNLRHQGIRTGFGFLGEQAGLQIPMTLVEYGPDATYARALLVAVLNTLLASAIAIALATPLGVLLAVGRLSASRLLRWLVGLFVEVARNVPLLLLVFVWYHGVIGALPAPRGSVGFGGILLNNRGLFLPQPDSPASVVLPPLLALAGAAAMVAAARRRGTRVGGWAWGAASALPCLVLALTAFAAPWEVPALRGLNVRGGVGLLPEFLALCLGLSLYASAFICEIVRGAILGVGLGQREAALALGMRPFGMMLHVVLPQAMRAALPPLVNQCANIVKNTSYGAIIAFPELVSVFVGSVLNKTGQALEIMTVTLGIYLAINLAISGAVGALERRLRSPGR